MQNNFNKVGHFDKQFNNSLIIILIFQSFLYLWNSYNPSKCILLGIRKFIIVVNGVNEVECIFD